MPESSREHVRASLRPKGGPDGYPLPFKGPGAALIGTRGIVFPFTPTIAVAQGADYAQHDMIHSNFQQQSFVRGRNPTITVTAKFSPQTQEEGRYFLGALHFLRVASKMHFGRWDGDAGTPPPVLEFSAYGKAVLNRIPVLVGDFTYTFGDDVDFMDVEGVNVSTETVGGYFNGPLAPLAPRSRPTATTARVPLDADLTINLLAHYSPARQRAFRMSDFASGDLYREGMI